MEIRQLQRDTMKHENGADAQRLVPWPALNAPFEGSWCVVEAGGATGMHPPHEYEIFIAVTGEAVLDSQGERRAFRAGGIVHFPPPTAHRVPHESSAALGMYFVGWDAWDAERFV